MNVQDHQLALAIPALKEDMVACQNKQSVKIDEAIKVLLTSTHRMVTENLPLSKFSLFVGLLNELHLESISVLKSFQSISYDSGYVHTKPDKFENATFAAKLDKMFSVHINPFQTV